MWLTFQYFRVWLKNPKCRLKSGNSYCGLAGRTEIAFAIQSCQNSLLCLSVDPLCQSDELCNGLIPTQTTTAATKTTKMVSTPQPTRNVETTHSARSTSLKNYTITSTTMITTGIRFLFGLQVGVHEPLLWVWVVISNPSVTVIIYWRHVI